MKKWLIWTTILIILILIAGIILFPILTRDETKYYGEKAIKENNMSICLEIEVSPGHYPMNCWRYVAYQESDINLCNIIDSELERNNCYTGFINVRWDNNQEVLCENLVNSKDKNYCYMVVGVASKDASFCDKISNPEFETQVADCRRNVAEMSKY